MFCFSFPTTNPRKFNVLSFEIRNRKFNASLSFHLIQASRVISKELLKDERSPRAISHNYNLVSPSFWDIKKPICKMCVICCKWQNFLTWKISRAMDLAIRENSHLTFLASAEPCRELIFRASKMSHFPVTFLVQYFTWASRTLTAAATTLKPHTRQHTHVYTHTIFSALHGTVLVHWLTCLQLKIWFSVQVRRAAAALNAATMTTPLRFPDL